VSVRAVLEGALIGLGVAFLLALGMAIVDYQLEIAPSAQSGLIWAGAIVTTVAAGWGGGRIAQRVSWLHGALAAITLNLVATVTSESLHIGSATHLWAGLGLAVVGGVTGGIVGAASQ
jgi:hydroxylaminobenzene mutase